MRSTVWENKSNAAEEKETEACCDVKAFSPRVMTRWSPSASPRCQQPMRASKPTVWQHDDITAASQIEKADLFSGVWNPAFVALQPGMFKASGGQTSQTHSSVFVGSRRRHLWLCLRFREQKHWESGLCGPPAAGDMRASGGGPHTSYREEGRCGSCDHS